MHNVTPAVVVHVGISFSSEAHRFLEPANGERLARAVAQLGEDYEAAKLAGIEPQLATGIAIASLRGCNVDWDTIRVAVAIAREGGLLPMHMVRSQVKA